MSAAPIRMTYREACKQAIRDALRADARCFVMGEDVGKYGGCYAVTKGLLEEFGPERITDTPLAEVGFVGAGVGAALAGLRPIVEIMTCNFSLLALDQIMNNAATLSHMSGGQFAVPLVIRMATGAGRQLAAQGLHHTLVVGAEHERDRVEPDPDERGAPAREYLASRGITRETAEEWELGYAPRELGLLRARAPVEDPDDAARELARAVLAVVEHRDDRRPRRIVRAAGLDPENLPVKDKDAMNFGAAAGAAKAWKDIWGAGQGVGTIDDVPATADLIARLKTEYAAAKAALCGNGI